MVAEVAAQEAVVVRVVNVTRATSVIDTRIQLGALVKKALEMRESDKDGERS
jgi:hypothetical protein